MEQNGAPAAGQQLAACPFCGGNADMVQPGTRRHSCIVECQNCGCRLESSDEGERSGQSWNRRAALPAAAACAEQGWAASFQAFMTAAQEIIDHNARELVSDWLTRAWHHKVLPKLASLPPPARNGEMSDERIDALLSDLDFIAREYEIYEYGLPMHGADEEDGPINKLRDAVRKWSASCAPKQTEGDGK